MLGDHNSFDDGLLSDTAARTEALLGERLKGILPPRTPFTGHERSRLARRGLNAPAHVEGVTTVGSMIGGMGQAVMVARHADHILHMLDHFEPRLDDEDWARSLFGEHASRLGDHLKLSWYLYFNDLALFEESTGTLLTILKGRT